MIVDAIINLFLGLWTFVLGLLPSFTAPVIAIAGYPGSEDPCYCGGANVYGIGALVYDYSDNIAMLNRWVDLPTIVTVLGLMIAITLAVGVARGVIWIYERIPFKSS